MRAVLTQCNDFASTLNLQNDLKGLSMSIVSRFVCMRRLAGVFADRLNSFIFEVITRELHLMTVPSNECLCNSTVFSIIMYKQMRTVFTQRNGITLYNY